MFVLSNERTRKPIKIWLPDQNAIEEGCLEQAYNLSTLPFVHKWISLMPDTHQGMGMPIGGVLATDGVIIPNAVGVDIGCGMMFVGTNLRVSDISHIQTGNGQFIQAVIDEILQNIPVGFARHNKAQNCHTMEKAKQEMEMYAANPKLIKHLEAGFFQVGTLGGGNHFIELQEDEDGFLGIMIHSGSRNLGKQICDYFHKKARDLNAKQHAEVPEAFQLAFFPVDSTEGQQYINWMNLALNFAMENRSHMMQAVKNILEKQVARHTSLQFDYTMEINCHHNYASNEQHYGKDVWVHRKGATRARLGEPAVIPGAMGSYSYVVQGLGNEESFHSCSHGAGRRFSRKAAMDRFSSKEVIEDLKDKGVVLGKLKKSDVAEESRFAYKDIDEVMTNQQDLVKSIKRLKTIGVIKG